MYITGKEAYRILEDKSIDSYRDIGDLIFHMGVKKYSNEESTKQGLILPYLNLLDFNTLNVNIVKPEFGIENKGRYTDDSQNVDIGKEIGKVDYLLCIENDFHLVEAKKLGSSLTKYIGQLKKYFDNLEGSKLGILTDGNYYLFFTDLEDEGFMDEVPFLCLGLINSFRDDRVEILSNLYKYTRFSSDYVSNRIDDDVFSDGKDSYIDIYNNCLNLLEELKLKGKVTDREWRGLNYLLNLDRR